jgi:hypothetical protein
MSVEQLIRYLGECRRRLSELRSRPDYLAPPVGSLSCAILRLEGAGGTTVIYDRPFASVLNDRPFHVVLTVSYSDTFALAFYPVTRGSKAQTPDAMLDPVELKLREIRASLIRDLLAVIEQITDEIHPLMQGLPRAVRARLQLPGAENWWRSVFHLAWHFPRPFLRATRQRLLVNNNASHVSFDATCVQLYGTLGLIDLLPGLVYSDLEHDLCDSSEAAIAVIYRGP